jgi:hypothetical protein
MKAYGEVDIYIHVFLTLALVGGGWSASWPGRFTSGEGAPDTHWIGGWVSPRTGPNDMQKRKFLPLPGFELWLPVVQPIPSLYTDSVGWLIFVEQLLGWKLTEVLQKTCTNATLSTTNHTWHELRMNRAPLHFIYYIPLIRTRSNGL